MQLSHANVVPVFDFGRAEDDYYLVMEWVDGVDLAVLARASVEPGAALSVAEVSYIGARVAHGLAHAHSHRIVHRDVKPSNILLSRAGQVHVTDFGVAMLAGADLPAAGTPAYMAPEQRRGQDVDARADIFALGVTLHHLACGAPSRDASEVRARAPAPLGDILSRMVAEDPDARPRDMEEVARELERLESRCIADGAELPRVTLQQRVTALRAGVSEGPSLELPFATAASLMDPGATASTRSGEAEPDARQEGAAAAAHDLGSATTVRADLDASHAAEVSRDLRRADATPAPPSGAAVPPAGPRGGRRRLALGALLTGALAAGLLLAWPRVHERALEGAPPHAAEPAPPRTRAEVPALEASTSQPRDEPRAAHAVPTQAEPSAPAQREAEAPEVPNADSGSPPAEPRSGARALRSAPSRSRAAAPQPTAEGLPLASREPDTRPVDPPADVASAHLNVGARPWAEVFVDGRRVGQTPITGLALPPGLHRVRLVNAPLDAQRTIDVRLASGETRTIREDME